MVSDFQSLTSATKTFILDVTGVLNSPLFCTREEFHEERNFTSMLLIASQMKSISMLYLKDTKKMFFFIKKVPFGFHFDFFKSEIYTRMILK